MDQRRAGHCSAYPTPYSASDLAWALNASIIRCVLPRLSNHTVTRSLSDATLAAVAAAAAGANDARLDSCNPTPAP